jgi:uncharacterized membrane protein
MRQWKCTVCGYLHEGEAPPSACPVCGADRTRFIPLEREKLNLLHDLVDTFMVHPVAAHFPNGLIPTAALFLLLALLTGSPFLEASVFYLLCVVLAVIPVSIASGIYEWRTRFRGQKAPIFYKKIALAALLLLLVVAATGLRCSHPELLHEGGPLRRLYLGAVLAMLPTVVLLGHYGAKLAWQWRKRRP